MNTFSGKLHDIHISTNVHFLEKQIFDNPISPGLWTPSAGDCMISMSQPTPTFSRNRVLTILLEWWDMTQWDESSLNIRDFLCNKPIYLIMPDTWLYIMYVTFYNIQGMCTECHYATCKTCLQRLYDIQTSLIIFVCARVRDMSAHIHVNVIAGIAKCSKWFSEVHGIRKIFIAMFQ